MAIEQDLSGDNYGAVIPITASAMFAPKRDVTNGVLTAGLRVVTLTDQDGTAIGTIGNPLITESSGTSEGVTPAAGTASTITTGGTAVTLVTGPVNGGYITNPPNAASQGIVTAENAYVSEVGTPGSTDGAANGTTTLLTSGQTFTFPALAAGVLIKGNAATSGHKLTVVVW
jgi:hypothetical protein